MPKDVQVNIQNPDEADVLAALKKEASRSLEADLLVSAKEAGLQQA